jgi:hypothetical protein
MFKSQIQELARKRETVFALEDRIIELEAEIAQSPLGILLSTCKDNLQLAKAERDQFDESLRTELIEYIAKTGDQKPHNAVTARRVKALKYDITEALAFCAKYEPRLVKMDLRKRDFESFAKDAELPFVEVEETLSVAIDSRLGDYL